jgi:hypothetical protein
LDEWFLILLPKGKKGDYTNEVNEEFAGAFR